MKKVKIKSVLVTGGGGFIGGAMIRILHERGYKVACFDRSDRNLPKGTPYIKGDILDKKAVEKAMRGKDIVFHLAGILGTLELQFTPVEAVESNVIGAINIFDAAVKCRTRVVLISKPNPWLNTYSITKEMSEKFCKMYERDFGLKAVIVKWFSVYGPGQKHYGVRKAVPTFIVAALQNEPVEVYGSGRQLADFIYVDDTVRATIDLAESPKAYRQTFEIGSGRGTSAKGIAKMIVELAHSKSKIIHVPMRIGEDLNTRVVAKINGMRKIISFQPKMSLKQGVAETIEYYRNLLLESHE